MPTTSEGESPGQVSTRAKRIRTVQGSCWTCRKRRVICDLTKPTCQKCIKADLGPSCNYDRRLLKWQTGLAARGHLAGKQIPVVDRVLLQPPPTPSILTAAERRALHYFQHELWPRLIISHCDSPTPVSSVLECQPLLLAICASADTHRVMRSPVTHPDDDSSPRTRLACIRGLRSSLADATTHQRRSQSLTAAMLTTIFLCFLDGYLAPHDEMASSTGHQHGVRAIVDVLGGPEKALHRVKDGELVVLSEFFSLDLTHALIRGGNPYLQPHLWSSTDASTAFWGNLGEPESLGHVFEVLATMARHVYLYDNTTELSDLLLIRQFEASLQPPRESISVCVVAEDDADNNAGDKSDVHVVDVAEQCHYAYGGQSLIRSFRHCALIYLYRAVCKLPTSHRLVQRQVHLCLEATSSLSRQEKLENCSLFPLTVAGAHSLADAHRETVMGCLARIGEDLKFANVRSLRGSLELLWRSGKQAVDWWSLFRDVNENVFIL